MLDFLVSRRPHHAAPPAVVEHNLRGTRRSFLASDPCLQRRVPACDLLKIVYPYSVVPGGIRSVQELKNAVANDPVVSAQFAKFQFAHARIIRLDRDRTIHVSYRRGRSTSYWTNRQLKLAKGETLITDGVQAARTRCGNMVSETVSESAAETVAAPVSPNEPPAQDFDTPVESSGALQEFDGDDPFPEIQFAPLSDLPSAELSVTAGKAPAANGSEPALFFLLGSRWTDSVSRRTPALASGEYARAWHGYSVALLRARASCFC